jgi:hypothetical protein
MRHTPGRPAGADNFVKWRRTIDEHLELGRLTWDEYGMFSWLCTKADQRTGRIRTSWPTLADQTTLSANYAGKLCRSLKGKGYIAFREHRGRRGGLVEVAIDKFPLLDGTYTALQSPRRRGQAEVPAHVPAEVPAELAAQRAEGSDGSLEGRTRERKRPPLRVRSADGTDRNGQPDPSGGSVALAREQALEAAPRALRETLELFWLKTGREDLTPEDLAALRDLARTHTPAVIQKAITESVERLRQRGEDPRALTLRYVWDSLRRFTTRTTRGTTSLGPERSAYPPGLTRLN